jgi:hypothetical protein
MDIRRNGLLAVNRALRRVSRYAAKYYTDQWNLLIGLPLMAKTRVGNQVYFASDRHRLQILRSANFLEA